MIRTFAIATLAAAAFAVPAMAETASVDAAASKAFGNQLAKAQTAEQARLQLAKQGYTGISSLDQDDDGRWVGTAVKDGKTIFVAVELPRSQQQAATN
jgi:hypothetical protein